MSAAVGLLVLLGANPLGSGTGLNAVATPKPAQLASFEWQTIPSPQRAGASISVTIRAKDENGSSYPFTGTALLSTTRGDVYVRPGYVQFSNGVCATDLVVTIAESLALRCSKDSAVGTSNVFEVLVGDPARLVAILPGEQLAPGLTGGRSGRPADRTAGDTFSLSVYLTDDWFNRIPLRDDSVYFGSSDRFGQLPAGGQLSNGTGSFTASMRTAGQHNIFTSPAFGEPLASDTSSTVSVFAGPYTQLLLLAPGETLLPGDTTSSLRETPGKSGTPVRQYLRIPFAITVYPCDQCWNPTVGPGDTVYLNSFFPFEVNPWKIRLLDSAVFSEVRATTAEFNQQCIWAADPTNGLTSYWTWLAIRALGATLAVNAPDTVRSGETAHVVTRVLDANGEPIVAALVHCSVVKGSGTMLDSALLTDTIGYASARFVCTPSPASELDSIKIGSGQADTVIGIYVSHLSDSLFAFPNPFGSINRDQALISYHLQRSTSVVLTIYDPFGNEVWSRHFSQGEEGARSGDNVVYWDGTDNKGRRVASGIYVIQLLGTLHTGIESRSTYRVGVVW